MVDDQTPALAIGDIVDVAPPGTSLSRRYAIVERDGDDWVLRPLFDYGEVDLISPPLRLPVDAIHVEP